MTQNEKIIALAELEGWTQKETSLSVLCFPGGYQKRNVTRWFRDGDVLCVNPGEVGGVSFAPVSPRKSP